MSVIGEKKTLKQLCVPFHVCKKQSQFSWNISHLMDIALTVFLKMLIQFYPAQWHLQFCDTSSAYPVHSHSSIHFWLAANYREHPFSANSHSHVWLAATLVGQLFLTGGNLHRHLAVSWFWLASTFCWQPSLAGSNFRLAPAFAQLVHKIIN